MTKRTRILALIVWGGMVAALLGLGSGAEARVSMYAPVPQEEIHPIAVPPYSGAKQGNPGGGRVSRAVDGRFESAFVSPAPSPSPVSAGTTPGATVRPRATASSVVAATRGRPRAQASPLPSVVRVVRGVASNMGPYDVCWGGPCPADYLALPRPYGPGWRVRICGEDSGVCITRVSNDTGPELWTGRVADLSVEEFALVCGCDWTRGLVSVTITYEGRA